MGKDRRGGYIAITCAAYEPRFSVIALNAPDATTAQRLGFLQGQITVPDDFDRIGGDEIGTLFGTDP